MQIQTEEIPKGNNVTLQILHDNLPGKDNNITVKDYSESDNELKGTYKIDGKEFGFTIDKNLNVKIGDVEKTIEEAFNMTVTNVDKTSLRATGDADKLNELGATEFTYVASTSGSSDIKFEHITTTSYDVTGLEPGTDYTVYMLAYDNAGNVKKSNSVKVTTKSLEIVTTDPYIGTSKTETNSTKSVANNSQTKGTTLYINFKATLEGTDCTITLKDDTTKTLPYEITANGTYTFVATGTYGEKTVTKEIEVKVNKYVSAGMLVKYDAGEWTEAEIGELKANSLYDINIYKLYSDKKVQNITFGGFTYKGDSTNESYINDGTVVTSRNQSVKPYSGSGKPKYEGWQILEVKDSSGITYSKEDEVKAKLASAETEKIYVTKLVHAGSPENFSYYNEYSINNFTYRLEYVLSGGQRQTTYDDMYKARDWSMYKDRKQEELIDEVHAMTYDEALAITGKKSTTTGVRKTGGRYVLASAASSASLSVVLNTGSLNNYNGGCYCVRPVVSLKSGVYIASGDGTEASPYVLDIVLIIIIAIGIIIVTKKIISNKKTKEDNQVQNEEIEQYVTVLEDGTKLNNSSKITENKKLQGLEITNTQITYNDGVTNLLANVKNTTKSDIDIQEVKIILLDENGKELYQMPGIIEAVKAGETIQFNSSITADFANAYDFKIMKK